MTRVARNARLGKYRLEQRIGDGASGSVWKARDLVTQQRVALKVVPPSVVAEFGADAIENEARIAARLDHPNVLAFRNADWVDGHFVIATELALRSLEGYSGARRSPELALSILRDLAAGLAHAHARSVMHRDIKPGNVLLFAGRRAKLADFGAARVGPQRTRAFTEVGTLGYLAPEQAYGRVLYASDVFSLALTAFELITGRLPRWPFVWPLEGHDRLEKRAGASVARVLRKALQVDAAKRFPDGTALERALERATAAEARATRRPRQKKPDAARPDLFGLEAKWFRRRYGKEFALDYDCHECGGPIAEAMRICPWCHSDRNSFREVTSFPLVCGECERGARPEWKGCAWCHAGRFAADGRTPPRDSRAVRTCSRRGCDGQLRPFMRYCPRCRGKVERPWRVAGAPACKRCRWVVAEEWGRCPWCARPSGY